MSTSNAEMIAKAGSRQVNFSRRNCVESVEERLGTEAQSARRKNSLNTRGTKDTKKSLHMTVNNA